MTSRDKYQALAHAFDVLAPTYDDAYGSAHNASMALMRTESLSTLAHTFPPGSRLLELGCGTGDEAIALARDGRHVVATDVAPAMVRITRKKAAAAGLSTAITSRVMPAAQLDQLAEPGPFDGAYASFGVLNAEPNLAAVARGLGTLLPPGAAFVASVMSQICLWEMLWFGLHLQPKRALRRWRNWALVPVGAGQAVATRFYRPDQFAAHFKPSFRVERKFALPLLLPPPYLDSLYQRQRKLFDRLATLDRRLRASFPFNALGDHFVVILRRV